MKGGFISMSWDILNNLLSNNAFPIVACIALAWYVYHTNTEANKRIDALNERVMTALNNNTEALTRLTEKLDREIN